MNKAKREMLKHFNRDRLIIYSAIAASLISNTISPPDNVEPGYVKNELINSSVSKRPNVGSSRGSSLDNGDEPLPKKKKILLNFEREELIKSLRTANVSLKQTAEFLHNYNLAMDENKKVSSDDMINIAKETEISPKQFKAIMNKLLEIHREKNHLHYVEKINGYNYLETPIPVQINYNGEAKFASQIKINNSTEFMNDINELNSHISKTKKYDNDNVNYEASNLILNAFIYADIQNRINNGEKITNSEKFIQNFEQDIKDYKLTFGKDGKLTQHNTKKPKSFDIHRNYFIKEKFARRA